MASSKRPLEPASPASPTKKPSSLPSATTLRGATALLILAVALTAVPRMLSQMHLAPAMLGATLPPALLYWPIVAVIDALESLLRNLTPPNLYLFRQVMGYVHTAEIHAAAVLGVADFLAEGPRSSDELAALVAPGCSSAAAAASSCGAVSLRVERLLRALAAYGVFREARPGVWANSPSSEFLRADHPATLHASARSFGGEQFCGMSELGATVVSGEAGFARVHGAEVWAWYAAHPEAWAGFDATMKELGVLGGADTAIANDFPWGAHAGVAVDVGGGRGDLLRDILLAHPRLRGVVFDLPSVVQRSQEHWARQGLSPALEALRPRLAFASGDMFVPATLPGAGHAIAAAAVAAAEAAAAEGHAAATGARTVCDAPAEAVAGQAGVSGAPQPPVAFLLRDIVHDWPDEDVVRILASLQVVLRTGGAGGSAGPLCALAEWRRGEQQEGEGEAGPSPVAVTVRVGSAGELGVRVFPSPPSKSSGAVDHVMLVARVVVPGAGFVESQGTADADVLMLGNFGTTAGERTLPHFSALLAASGLELVSVTPTRGMFSVLQARAVGATGAA